VQVSCWLFRFVLCLYCSGTGYLVSAVSIEYLVFAAMGPTSTCVVVVIDTHTVKFRGMGDVLNIRNSWYDYMTQKKRGNGLWEKV
jgi:hypothetical protein